MAYKRPRPSGTDAGGRVPTGGAHRLLRAAVRRSATRTAAILLCSVASAGAAVASPAVVGHTLDLLLDRHSDATSWVVLSAALLTAEVLLDAAVALLTGVTNARSTAWLRTGALGRLLATSPDRASPLPPGDVATRLSVNATEAGTVPAAAAALTASLLGPAGAVIALLFIDVWVALAFLAGLPLLVVVLRAFARNSSDTVGRYQQIQSDIASRLLEALDGARTIAAAGTEDRERARILQPLAGLDREGRRMWRIHGRAVANSQVLLPLLTTAVLGVGGVRLAAGAISVGELLAASRYAALAAGMGALAGLLGAIVRGRSAAARLAVLQDLPAVRHGEGTLPHEGSGTVELRGVTVVREGRTVLTDVHLVVPGGTTAAVVGRSGAGKSTLAAVAGLLTEPDEGCVLLDGVPLHSLRTRPVAPGGRVRLRTAGLPGGDGGRRHRVGGPSCLGGRDPYRRTGGGRRRLRPTPPRALRLARRRRTSVGRGTATPRAGPRVRARGPAAHSRRRHVQSRHRHRTAGGPRPRPGGTAGHPAGGRAPDLLGEPGGPGDLAGGRPGTGRGAAP